MNMKTISGTRAESVLAILFAASLLSLPCLVSAEDAAKGKPMSHADMVKQATAHSASANRIERLSDGRAKVPAKLQAIEAFAGPDSVTIVSTAKDEPGSFTIRPVSLGRTSGTAEALRSGRVAVQQDRVDIIRQHMTEELTTSADGVRQDFIIQKAPKGEGELVLELAFEGAKLGGKGDGIGVVLEQGRELIYHRLLVTDAAGKRLPARFDLREAGNLRIVVADAGTRYPVRIDPTVADADWVSIALPDTNGDVLALAWDGTNLYAGGNFTAVGGVSVNYIAKWNGSEWSALGSGVNASVCSVSALVWDGTNLYVGGHFTTAGDVSANNIAKWDGSTWSALGTGMGTGGLGSYGYVYALAWDGTNLYAGGEFTIAGGVSANNIAKWDGSTWSALGAGMNNDVNALAWDGMNLYAGGRFTTAGGVSANYIAKWNGNAWSTLGTGMNNYVYALDREGTNLYAGGYFTTAGGVSAKYVAKWDGSTWSALGTGMNSLVYALAWNGTNLYAGGYFTTAGGVSANRIAKWNGSAWSAEGTGMNSNVNALAWAGTNLYAGGNFATAGGVNTSRIAKWNGSSWSSLGTGMNGFINALASDGTNLYAGGSFTSTGTVSANYIAKWNGNAWSTLGTGMNGTVFALTWDGTNLYAGGRFSTAGGVIVNYIAKWDGSAWSALGTGMNSDVNALAWNGTGLYAAGIFTTAGGVSANRIAKWNGSNWSALGTGVNNSVLALGWDGTNLYTGGTFTAAGGVNANYIAKWNGSAWSTLGTGMSDLVRALVWDGTNLYAGGGFWTVGGITAPGIAKWDGSAWSPLGTGSGRDVYSLAWDGTNLYVGGSFTTAGGASTNYIAKWNGSAWSALGNGLNGSVHALVLDNSNHIFATGYFTQAGGSSSKVAYSSIAHRVTATAGANGSIAPGSKSVYHGETTTFTVTPNAGYTATIDSTCGTGLLNGNTYTTSAVMNDCAVTATFGVITYQVNVSVSGSGTVTSFPAGINCGITCLASFATGTVVTLTATPGTGQTFSGWSGDPDCSDGSVTMDAPKTCTATFETISPPSSNIRFIAWQDNAYGNNEILMKRSTDNGATWGPANRLTNTAGSSVSPVLAVDGQSVYLAWQDDSYGNNEILLKKSTDSGLTWGATQRMTNNSSSSVSPVIAVNGTTVYLAWQDDAYGNTEVLLKKSADGGTTWGPALRITNNTSSSVHPVIAVSGANVYLAWQDDAYGNNEVLVKRSSNGGATWGTAQRITNSTGSSLNPVLALDGANVYLAWQDDVYGNNEVLLRKSADAGMTWGYTQRVTNNSSSSVNPVIAVNGQNLYLAWQDDGYGNNEVLQRKSVDGGASWGYTQRITNGSGSSANPVLAVYGANVYAAWQDDVYGNNEIMLRRSADGGATWVTSARITNNASLSAGPRMK